MNANGRPPKCHYILWCCLLLSNIHYAQPSRWQWGIGASAHSTAPDLQLAPVARSQMAVRTGLSGLARYRLNRKANWQWGPFRNRLNLFWETGLGADNLAYTYMAGTKAITRDFVSLEIPLRLVMVSDVRGFPGWSSRRLHGYGRLGGSAGFVLPRKIDGAEGDFRESSKIGGLRAAIHLSSGLLRKLDNGGHSSVGIFARFGLTSVVKGQLVSGQMDPPLLFRSAGSLFGLEWSYFFGQPAQPRLPIEPVDMILCPRF